MVFATRPLTAGLPRECVATSLHDALGLAAFASG